MKRLNHIHNDNEIYAKGVIKVPDKPLSAILAGIHTSGRNSPQNGAHLKKEQNETTINHTLLNLIPTPSEEIINDVIFNTTIASKPTSLDNEVHDEDEEITLIPRARVVQSETQSTFSCNGADADISWLALIVCIVTLIVAVPLIFVLYIAEHPKMVGNSSHEHTVNHVAMTH